MVNINRGLHCYISALSHIDLDLASLYIRIKALIGERTEVAKLLFGFGTSAVD